jgi:uncharacterized ParB-like nuclease family protein
MAKRKRLTPAQPDYFNTTQRAPEVKSMSGPDFTAPSPAPIAQVAGEAATRAALDEVTGVLQDARQQGRLIESLALESINPRYLVRDRMMQDDDDMAALMASLRARGQQAPIEVTVLSPSGDGFAYGLISGWRRLYALQRLYEETSEDRFATIKALVVTPETAQDAYLAMVEENEIRANLSLYERARIALRATREGVFPTPRHAVLALFGSVSRPKRSKIGTFVGLVEALEPVLTYPTVIPEKLGLKLSAALVEDEGLAKRIAKRLTQDPPKTSAAELRILMQETSPAWGPAKGTTGAAPVAKTDSVPALPASSVPGEVVPGVRVRFDQGLRSRIELSGVRVDDALCRALKLWLVEFKGRSEKDKKN